MRRFAILLFSAIAAAQATASARADLFVLHTGGQIEGNLLNPTEKPRQNYIVQTPRGQITLAAAQVQRVVEVTAAQRRYAELVPRVEESAAGHWKMAEWCKAEGLETERAVHLEQVLKHDPDHATARAALGYGKIDDRWVKADDHMRSRGYVLHKGTWRIPQEVAMEEQDRARAEADKNWKIKLRMWKSWLGKRRNDDAVEELRTLRDPAAANALVEMLQDETQSDVKLLFLGPLTRINTPTSTLALLSVALTDDSARLRDMAIDALHDRGDKGVVRLCLKRLQDKDNETVNRAAVVLGRLGDAEAVLPLIEALSTKHRVQTGSGSGGMGLSFNSGSGGLGVGSSLKIVEKEVRNGSALNALLVLTGGNVNFHFDKDAWKDWYVHEREPKGVNLRRDE